METIFSTVYAINQILKNVNISPFYTLRLDLSRIKNKRNQASIGRMCRLSTVLTEVTVVMAANDKRELGPPDQSEERVAQWRQFP